MDATDALRVRPVILSGGSGTRLWPLSRRDWPKQLIALTGDHSLLQLTALRTPPSDRFAAPIVVASERHADEIVAQLGEVGIAPDCVILEPAARNTAPAVALAAFAADPEEQLLVMPSDHRIADGDAFLRAIDQGAALARRGWMVTLGLAPTRPETGFGYIRVGAPLDGGARAVAEFVEKPERARAEAYCAAGDYLWNGGIFLFTAGRFLAELQRHARPILGNVRDSFAAAVRDGPWLRPDRTAFAGTPSVSIDFAVMEKVDRIAVVPVEMGWSDVGSWDALHECFPGDESGNRLNGDVIVADTSGCSIRSAGPIVAAVGVENLTIIATSDAVLVMPKGRSQDISGIIEQLRARQSATLDAWAGSPRDCARGA
jgi:mannose-1-phosphate guanylyltransferase/mannose-1-phosphate guanylyltransferase/mannose-6-phosphate isomerase